MLLQCHPLPPPILRTTTAMKYQKVRMPMNLLIDSLRRSELQPVSGSGKEERIEIANVCTVIEIANVCTVIFDRTLKKSVARQIRKERQSLTTVTLEGVEVDNTLGSLAQLSNELWFGTALSKHKRGSLFLHYTRISRNIRKPNL